jgi:hypothetical protein
MVAKRCQECGRDDYQNPSVTVDAVATREGVDGLELLMIKRGKILKSGRGCGHFLEVLSITGKTLRML